MIATSKIVLESRDYDVIMDESCENYVSKVTIIFGPF